LQVESLGTFGTLYVVSAVLGFGYMIVSMASGHLGHDAGGDSGDHGAFDGHDTGAHDVLGHHHAIGHDTGAHSVAHGHGDGHGGDDAAAQLKEITKVGNVAAHHRQQTPVLLKIMSWISPASMAIFLAFFGLTGMAIFKLGALSLVPAIAVGLIMRNVVMMLLRWFIRQSHVSTTSRVEECIGHAAEVCVSIQPGRTGEITYVLGSKRYNMPAKMSAAEGEYKRGSKVLISDVRDGVVFVAPWQELTI
jgi:hypothetical protein